MTREGGHMHLWKTKWITITNGGTIHHVQDNQVPRITQATSIFDHQVTVEVKELIAYTTTNNKQKQRIQK